MISFLEVPMPKNIVLLLIVLGLTCFSLIAIGIEHYMEKTRIRRKIDLIEIWVLRCAGIWILFWFLWPTVMLAQNYQNNRTGWLDEQVSINTLKTNSNEARIQALETLRIDARLSLVESSSQQTSDEMKAMRQWIFGIFGGILLLIVTQLFGIKNRSSRG